MVGVGVGVGVGPARGAMPKLATYGDVDGVTDAPFGATFTSKSLDCKNL